MPRASSATLVAVALAVSSRRVVADKPGQNPVSGGSTFVHLFEWSWSDVAKECEQWLGPKGFTAVQVSPPMDHIQGDAWWTRYQPLTYTLTSRSGNEAAFADMVRRCSAVGVGIYADVVNNHIAAGSGVSIAGNTYGDRSTPIYTQEDMHHNQGNEHTNCGVSNYADKYNVQSCDLVGLPDLCTGCKKVQDTVVGYIEHMSQLGISGIRIDAAKHQDAGELSGIVNRVKRELFVFQEVISGGAEAVTPQMYFNLGHVTEFNFARQVAPNIINDGKMQYFGNFGEAWGLIPSDRAVLFLDNHDTQRGEAKLTYKNGKLYEFANIFMLASPYGYPKVMSSYNFNDHDQGPPHSSVHSGESVSCGQGAWVCEHRWTPVANMVAWRKSGGASQMTNFQAPGGDTIAFCRGPQACIAMNRMESTTWNVKVFFAVPPGKYCDIIRSDDASSCPTIDIPSGGMVQLQVPPLGAVAVHVGKKVGSLVAIV